VKAFEELIFCHDPDVVWSTGVSWSRSIDLPQKEGGLDELTSRWRLLCLRESFERVTVTTSVCC
jgi:hypothetical protein